MTDQDNSREGSLVRTGGSELAPVGPANPLVSRGLADITRGDDALKRIETSAFVVEIAISYYLSGADWFKRHDYSKAREDLDEAIRLLDEAIRLSPNSPLARRHRGNACWCRCVTQELIEDDEQSQAHRNASSSAEAYYEKALRDFDEAIRLEPDNALAHAERGAARSWGSHHDEGIHDFDEAIRLEPGNAAWRAIRGHVSLGVNDYDRAIICLKEAIRINGPNQPEVLIVFVARKGQQAVYFDYEGGNPFLSESVRINLTKTLASVYEQRGYAWLAKGNHDEAIKDFTEALRLGTSGMPSRRAMHFFRGICLYKKAEYDQAIKDFTEVIRLDPSQAAYYHVRGLAWNRKGEFGAANRDINEALRLDPKYELSQDLSKEIKVERLRWSLQKGQDRREAQNKVPRKLEIHIPGRLAARPFKGGFSVILADTPGIVEIDSTTLADARERTLLERKRRLEKFRELAAPEVIIQNEIRMMKRSEDAWKDANHCPENCHYEFRLKEGYFEPQEFERGLAALAALKQLILVDLTGCPVTDEGLACLQYLPGLRRLYLENCVEITDRGLGHLRALPRLEGLDLAGCLVTDCGLALLSGLKRLEWINLQRCHQITQRGVMAFKAALPECEVDVA
jgi:tetratricopeptide (TPR) repeat protein